MTKDERISQLEAECASLRTERDKWYDTFNAKAWMRRAFAAEAELVEQRCIGHGEGQEQTIADVNAGRVDDLITPRLGRETRALRDQLEAVEQLIPQWRKRGFGAPMQRHACSSCGLTDEEYAEVDGWNRAVSRCADRLEAALASPSGHSPNCAIWRGVSVHPESEPLPCDCALASPSGAETP